MYKALPHADPEIEDKEEKERGILRVKTNIAVGLSLFAVLFVASRYGAAAPGAGYLHSQSDICTLPGTGVCATSMIRNIPSLDSDNDMADCVELAIGTRYDGGIDACANLLWPLPKVYLAGGKSSRKLSSSLKIQLAGDASDSEVLQEAAERYLSLIFSHGESETDSSDSDVEALVVQVTSSSDSYPTVQTDVSYKLILDETGPAILNAETVYGALHGLETFAQLVTYTPYSDTYELTKLPIHINDEPRFDYRGVMVDCARHFIPISFLERVIDTMSYAKLNVLHLHLSDQESFPTQSTVYPELWNASFSVFERYTKREMRQLVKYAHVRGVIIVPEFDSPSHSKSMCTGAPDGVCMDSCSAANFPLRPLDETFEFLKQFWREEVVGDESAGLEAVFPSEIVHSGGDEVKTACWDDDNVTALWMEARNLTAKETYLYFVNKNIDMLATLGKSPVMWNDGFDDFTTDIHPDATIMFWTTYNDGKQFKEAARKGYQVIAATSDPYYLSNSNEYSVKDSYEYDPCNCENHINDYNCVNTTDECSQILGVETAFWTSDYDVSNLENSLFPRALAMAERAWSPSQLRFYTNSSDEQGGPATADRLGVFRCRMLQRGTSALPLFAPWKHKYGGNRVGSVGSCMFQ